MLNGLENTSLHALINCIRSGSRWFIVNRVLSVLMSSFPPAASRPSPQVISLVILAVFYPLPTPAEVGAGMGTCSRPRPGRYVVMQKGSAQHASDEQPVARLLQEVWKTDGRINGMGFERIGKRFQEVHYTGTYRVTDHCRVQLTRTQAADEQNGQLNAEAVLDPFGRPRYSLSTALGSTITGVWRQQENAPCTPSTLKGTVLSQQHGLSWQRGWLPNAVVQREIWKGESVQGFALSSYAGALERAVYTGTIDVQSDCTATVVQRDSKGIDYNYRSLVMADGSGYFYLQQDPDDLTVGWLENVTPDALHNGL